MAYTPTFIFTKSTTTCQLQCTCSYKVRSNSPIPGFRIDVVHKGLVRTPDFTTIARAFKFSLVCVCVLYFKAVRVETISSYKRFLEDISEFPGLLVQCQRRGYFVSLLGVTSLPIPTSSMYQCVIMLRSKRYCSSLVSVETCC